MDFLGSFLLVQRSTTATSYSQVQLISVKLDSYKQMWITLENILSKSLLLRLKFCSESRRLDVCNALQRTPVPARTPNLERRVNIGDSKV